MNRAGSECARGRGQPPPRRRARTRRGFALVMVISIMAFLVLLMVGLGLVLRLETGSASAQQKMAEARQNAILGLYTAIGQLQELAGPDQRVTANAGISTNTIANPHWTGVWRRQTNVPLLPGITGSSVAFNPHPAEFLGWLVSGKDSRATNNAGAEIKESERLALLSTNQIVNANDQVFVGKEAVVNGTKINGHFAYWVSDESLKAKINLEDVRKATNGADPTLKNLWTAFNLATGRPPELSILDSALSGWVTNSAISSKRTKMEFLQDAQHVDYDPGTTALQEHFHDLTTHSKAVLSDTLNGGLKKDLSLAFNMSDAEFNADTLFGGRSFTVARSAINVFPDGGSRPYTGTFNYGLIFPRPGDSNLGLYGPTWQKARSYALLGSQWAQGLLPTSNITTNNLALAAISVPFSGVNTYGDQWCASAIYTDQGGPTSTANDPRVSTNSAVPRSTQPVLAPIVTQVAWGLSLKSSPVTETNTSSNGAKTTNTFNCLKFVVDPFAAIWNPYDVPIKFAGVRIRAYTPNVSLTLPSGTYPMRCLFTDAAGSTMEMYLVNNPYPATNSIVLQPGEIRVFYSAATNRALGAEITLTSEFPTASAYENAGLEYSFNVNTNKGGVQIPRIEVTNKIAGNLTLNSEAATEFEVFTCPSYSANTSWRQLYRLYQNSTAASTGINYTNTDADSAFTKPFEYSPNDLAYKCSLGVGKYYLKDASTNGSTIDRVLLDNNLRGMFLRNGGGGYPAPTNHPALYEMQLIGTLGGNITDKVGVDLPASAGEPVRGFWGGGGGGSSSDVSFASIFRVPRGPLLSIGELQHFPAEDWHCAPSYAIGNSYASPYLAADNVFESVNGWTQLDHSYLLNHHLFDSFYFSGIGPRPDRGLTQAKVIEALGDPYNQERLPSGNLADGPLPNPRIVVRPGKNKNDIMTALNPGSMPSVSADRPYSKAAELLMVDGPFNVNSTSVDAWKTVLASTASAEVPVFKPDRDKLEIMNDTGVSFPRCLPANGGSDAASVPDRWQGYRSLDSSRIALLATNIVEQVKARGPFLSLSDFVNRRLDSSSNPHSQRGALQAAIDASGINTGTSVSPTDFKYPDNAKGHADAGAPGYLLQGDILQTLAPILTARGDTFLVRSYGDAVNPSKPTDPPEAKAYCEAIVQRLPEKVDSGEKIADPDPAGGVGRRFRIVAFRWIPNDEI